MEAALLTAELSLPARANEPFGGGYYNLIPVRQADTTKALAVAVQDDLFEEGINLVYGDRLTEGQTQFRFDFGDKAIRLRSRNSGKVAIADTRLGKWIQFTFKDGDAIALIADIDLVPVGRFRYELRQHLNPNLRVRLAANQTPALGGVVEFSESASPPLEFYLVPVETSVWLEGGETQRRPYQDALQMGVTDILSGLIGFGGDKLSEFAGIPGGSAILGGIFSLVWPSKSVDDILAEFREHLLEDIRRLKASDSMIAATNNLLDVRRKYTMIYRELKRSDIDRSAAIDALRETARRYADDYGTAILGLLPGVMKADGTLPISLDKNYRPLIYAGLGVYAQGAVDHVMALQEVALLHAFDPDFVIRAFPRLSGGRFIDGARDDSLRAANGPRDRSKHFVMLNVEDGTLRHGDQISLQTSQGSYLSAWGGGGALTAIAEKRGYVETFGVLREAGEGLLQAGDRVTLVSSDGGYLTAVGGGGGELNFSAYKKTANEIFVITAADGQAGPLRSGRGVGLKVANGHFVSALQGGGDVVKASSPHLAGWETFALRRVSVGHRVRYGNIVVLRRPDNGRFAAVVKDGTLAGRIVAKSGRIGPTALFTIDGATAGTELADDAPFRLRTSDGRFVGIDAQGNVEASTQGTVLNLDVLRPSNLLRAGPKEMLGAPIDWLKSWSETYDANVRVMAANLLYWRVEELKVTRVPHSRAGFITELRDNGLNRCLHRAMDPDASYFPATDAWIDEIKKQYLGNLGSNLLQRYQALIGVVRCAAASVSTNQMVERLTTQLEASTEYWRQSVLPGRDEWEK